MADPFPWVTSEDGWPYPDEVDPEDADIDSWIDDDVISLHALPPRVLAGLGPLERQVLAASFGLEGAPVRSIAQLHDELGRSAAELEAALGDGLAKLRAALT